MKASEIMETYYHGEHTVEEVNKLLAENGHKVRMAAGLKILSQKEKEITSANMEKGILSGWALVNIGVGGLEKMQVEDGKLIYPIGNTGFPYVAYMGGKEFRVTDGAHLTTAE